MNRMFRIVIAYDGTNYSGWQKQPNASTVELELMKACKKLFSNEVIVKGSSRTDAGVHAIGQVASIEVDTMIHTEKLAKAINAHLPKDIIVQDACEVHLEFHPRYDAIQKTYIYRIYNAKMPLPQHSRYAHYVAKMLDLDAMSEAMTYFIGKHDFLAFTPIGGSDKTTIRTIYSCTLNYEDGVIEIRITGKSFLYKMVRIIVGTLIEVGLHRRKPEDIPAIIQSKERLKAGKTAPAKGLTLINIMYLDCQE